LRELCETLRFKKKQYFNCVTPNLAKQKNSLNPCHSERLPDPEDFKNPQGPVITDSPPPLFFVIFAKFYFRYGLIKNRFQKNIGRFYRFFQEKVFERLH